MSILAINNIRRLSLGLPILDDVFPGFELGDFAVLCDNAALSMSFALSVRTQLPCKCGGLESAAVFVDGGNSFSPYEVAETARSYGLDCRQVLERIHVSRAFTAYQFSSLILEKLHPILRRTRAKLLIVSDITSLFMDSDIPKIESRKLFVKICSGLSVIASRKRIVVVVIHFPAGSSRQSVFFEATLFGKCTALVKLKKKGGLLSVSLDRYPHFRSFSMDFTTDKHYAHVYEGVTFGENCPVL